MSSGAIIVQIIILILLHNAFHLFPCKVLGCTDIHAQRRIVDTQIQMMLRRDLRDAQFSASRDPSCEGSAGLGLASAVEMRSKRTDIEWTQGTTVIVRFLSTYAIHWLKRPLQYSLHSYVSLDARIARFLTKVGFHSTIWVEFSSARGTVTAAKTTSSLTPMNNSICSIHSARIVSTRGVCSFPNCRFTHVSRCDWFGNFQNRILLGGTRGSPWISSATGIKEACRQNTLGLHQPIITDHDFPR